MIDLHLHSSVSDGTDEPDRVVELALEAGCSAIALTDHDSLAGVLDATKRAEKLGVALVSGCEVSCSTGAGQLHLLCYFVDEKSPLADLLEVFRTDRTERNVALVGRLREMGIPLTLEEVAAEAGGEVVGRPHVAARLVAHGAATSIADAFDRYLAPGRPGHVPRRHVEAREVIEAAHHGGALTVLAHPFSLLSSDSALAEEVGHLARAGLDGLECLYASYDPGRRARLLDLAKRHGLVATGGSDYHGSYKPGLSIGTGRGDLEVPDSVLEALVERRSRPLP